VLCQMAGVSRLSGLVLAEETGSLLLDIDGSFSIRGVQKWTAFYLVLLAFCPTGVWFSLIFSVDHFPHTRSRSLVLV